MRRRNIVSILVVSLLLTSAFANLGFAADPANNVESLVHENHWKRARAILEPEVAAHPQDARNAHLLAQAKMALGDLDGALALAQRAVDLDGANSDYHFTLGQVYGEKADRASIFAAGPLALKFRKEVEKAIALNPKNLDALDAMMQFKFEAPSAMGGSRQDAQDLAQLIARIDPVQGCQAQAELAGMEKDPAEQQALLAQAVQAGPQNYGALVDLGKFYSQPNSANYAEAAKLARRAIQLEGKQAGAYWVLARVLALQKNWGELDQTLATAERQVPDDLRPFYEAARGMWEVGAELPQAELYVRKYLTQEPEGGEPDVADAHRLLGLLFEKEARTAEARTELRTAIQLRPNFRAAREDLKRLGI